MFREIIALLLKHEWEIGGSWRKNFFQEFSGVRAPPMPEVSWASDMEPANVLRGILQGKMDVSDRCESSLQTLIRWMGGLLSAFAVLAFGKRLSLRSVPDWPPVCVCALGASAVLFNCSGFLSFASMFWFFVFMVFFLFCCSVFPSPFT